ncbi:MAG: helix-turn-helix transcriptional regulator [Flavobacteriales bacterium]|nr:helix-turn-helix transcriptional regulator [Flavobacteriales bacterium]
MSSSLDTKKFSEMIKSKRGSTGLRALATEIGISASTLSRVEQGNLPDIDTYLRLCNWLEVSSDFFTLENKNIDSSKKGVIAHLRADKSLPANTAEALIQMINLAYASSEQESQI